MNEESREKLIVTGRLRQLAQALSCYPLSRRPPVATAKTNRIRHAAVLAALVVALLTHCGCASSPLPSSATVSGHYWLTVEFNPTPGSKKVFHKMEIAVSPGVPFALKTQDLAGDEFEVAGTMRQIAPERFAFDGGKIHERLSGGGEFGGGIGPLSVGQRSSGGFGPERMGASVSLTKK